MAWLRPVPSSAYALGPACGARTVKNGKGISIQVLFAKNGAVQRYLVVGRNQNVEEVNDLEISLERVYGPADIGAPPVRIVSFKAASGGLQIPDKAVDSCGRTLSFQ